MCRGPSVQFPWVSLNYYRWELFRGSSPITFVAFLQLWETCRQQQCLFVPPHPGFVSSGLVFDLWKERVFDVAKTEASCGMRLSGAWVMWSNKHGWLVSAPFRMEKKPVTRVIFPDWAQSEHIKVVYLHYDECFDKFVRNMPSVLKFHSTVGAQPNTFVSVCLNGGFHLG